MSEIETAVDVVEASADSSISFEAWYEGSTGIERSVEVLQRGDLQGKWENWVRRYERAQEDSKSPENETAYLNPGAEPEEELTPLEVEGQALIQEIKKHRFTWYFTGIQTEQEQEIFDAHPWPKDQIPLLMRAVPKLAREATEKQSTAFLKAYDLYEKAKAEHDEKIKPQIEAHAFACAQVALQRGFKKIAKAFQRVEDYQGNVILDSITPEQVEKMYQKLGDVFFAQLINTVDAATANSEPIPGDSDFLSAVSAKTNG